MLVLDQILILVKESHRKMLVTGGNLLENARFGSLDLLFGENLEVGRWIAR